MSLNVGNSKLTDNIDSKLDTKEYNPPKNYAPGLISAFINWVEAMNSKFSRFGNPPVYDNSIFPWVGEIESNWMEIRKELDGVIKERERLPNFQDIMAEIEPISNDNTWKTFFLAGYGLESTKNAEKCPETAKLLKNIPGMKTALFSIISPNKHIPPHKGPYNGVLRYHLGLIVPEQKEKCRIRVSNQIRHWEEGKSIIFDDTFNHEVWNDTPDFRSVLFVDFVRPVKFPFNLFNSLIINAAVFAPFLKEAEQKHKEWEKKFYKQ